jgi:tripartite-type tricarboxylate transporter receptor subunit TctC
VLVVHPSVKAVSVKKFIDLVQVAPGKLKYTSEGTGSAMHPSAALLIYMAGVNMTHVPHKGNSLAVNVLRTVM